MEPSIDILMHHETQTESSGTASFQHDKKLQFRCVAQEDLLLATGHPKLQAFQRKLPGPTALRSDALLHCAILSVYHPRLLLGTVDASGIIFPLFPVQLVATSTTCMARMSQCMAYMSHSFMSHCICILEGVALQ